ncbi:helix-turn-helix transcriptional regulator [Eisenbergiella porci]|uniref:helix-turn-helix transcriptional regulator n=1 Tax=Eisenbergiella porci TaxID=2652274 RepID=UPI002A8341A5|nr:helix-turn-helix transcriptional regulator [Eisenbergiella porci]
MKNRIKELREAKEITQEQLGELVGVSRQAINALENGIYEPSIWLAYDIAGVFGCLIEEVFLFGESTRKSRSDKSRGSNFTQQNAERRKNGNTAAAISGR